MRRQAGTQKPARRGPRARALLLTWAATLLFLLIAPLPAHAAEVTDRPLLFSFDGADTFAGAFLRVGSLEIDQSSGTVYVIDQDRDALDKLNAAGEAESFSSTGSSSLIFQSSDYLRDVAVDNTGVNPGQIHVVRGTSNITKGNAVSAFDPAGEPLWSPPLSLSFYPTTGAIDAQGRLWLNERFPSYAAHEYASSGSPPGSPPNQLSYFALPIWSDDLYLGAEGSLYAVSGRLDRYEIAATGTLTSGSKEVSSVSGSFVVGEAIFGYGIPAGTTVAAVGPGTLTLSNPATASGTLVPLRSLTTIDPIDSRGVTVDQSEEAGHVFALHPQSFNEYDASGNLVGEWASAAVIRTGGGIAYSSFDPDGAGPQGPLDRVYVSDRRTNSAKVFGPPLTGTVPDAIAKDPTDIGYVDATLQGTVNPQGVPNSYFFEWKVGEGKEWGQAETSLPQSLPEDSSDHPVTFKATGLKSNTAYQFRIVTENTELVTENKAELGLRSISAPVPFTTDKPPVPVVSIEPPSAITTNSAHISGTITPFQDKTTWRVQTSTDESCATGFVDEPLQEIPAGVVGAVDVEWDLALLPSQRYCVRIEATNGGGTSYSDVEVFETGAIPPSEAETSFAAPRLDTSAWLNALVNPEGAPLTYSFEYSSDGGANWQPMPPATDESEAREQVYVAQEISGLMPDTTYLYQLAAVSNAAGPEEDVALPSAVRTFTTRTSAEVNLPAPRGIELVNPPDKGTQNVKPGVGNVPIDPSSPSGDQMLWTLTAGAPGANTASGDLFLAERTGQTQAAPNGWQSKSLIPPPAEQYGKGRFPYGIRNATPDFGRFFFRTGESNPLDGAVGEQFYVRIGGGSEEVLGSAGRGSTDSQVSEDGNHFVVVGPSGQLVDLEAPGKETLLSLMPDGAPSACALRTPASWPGAGGTNGGFGISWRPGYSAIARADASRVYFQVQPAGECGGIGEPEPNGLWGLYVRNRAANGGAGQTTLIDPGSIGYSPYMIRATPDGEQAYFVTHSDKQSYEGFVAGMTKEEKEGVGKIDPEGIDENNTADVYRWEESKTQSVCLTCQVEDEAGNEIEGAAITPLTASGAGSAVIVSDDFSHIYFTSTEQLVPGEGSPAGNNLYLLSGGVIRFVAAVGGAVLEPANAEASADGNLLGFSTLEVNTPARQLTADDVAATCPSLSEKGTNSSCIELYLYDDRARSLECLSCLRGGLTRHSFRGTLVNQALIESGRARNGFALSSDGSTVAFTTAQKLLPEDVNNGTDVYEWRNGQLRLITNGVSKFAEGLSSPVATALDDDGSDLFFAVADPGLTGYEQDEMRNLYDARIGGGFPRPAPPAHCSEESCQGPLQAPPALDQPASSNPSRGNVPPARKPCRKGKVRRHGRCVARHPHKRHHKRSHKRAANTNRGAQR